jgi:hypothetical protein
MPYFILLALWLLAAVAHASPVAKDTVTLKTIKSRQLDFDGDGQLDTLYMTQQRREREGKILSTRAIPGFIAWGDTTVQTSYDTTVLDLPKGTDMVVGVRLADLNEDKIIDIEVLYRWLEKPDSAKSVQEKIWQIIGGPDLRSERTVKLSNAKRSLSVASSVLSERSAESRDAEQPIGIGGYAIRRIRPTADEKPKRRADAGPESPSLSTTLEVFPNPASDAVHVSILGATPDALSTVEIVDQQGRVVLKLKATPEMDIDIRAVISGTYRIRMVGCEECPATVQFQIAR